MAFDCCYRGKVFTKEIALDRHVQANNPGYNQKYKYANNSIRTTKYNLFTFLPKNLFEQFQRIANTYFLCLLILQLFPAISSLPWYNTFLPLVFVLGITAVKDALDDIKRHISDRKANNRLSWVLRDGEEVEKPWHNIVVGDIIKMTNDQPIAADLLLLFSSNYRGVCYVDTAELDGETNLKVRHAVSETANLEKTTEDLKAFDGTVTCQHPNNILNKFVGSMVWKNTTLHLDNDNILLRGCVLRNTQWCYGLVIYTGHDSKVMMNSGKSVFKRTHIDRLLNYIVIGIVICLLVICIFMAISCIAWEANTGQYFQAFLPWESFVPGSPSRAGSVTEGATVISVLVFFSYIIILNTVVPISLYVSVEIFRMANSLWINWDVEMYNETTDTPAWARSTALNEELGHIEYIFSDKTGTLTQNIMTLNKCSIYSGTHGDVYSSCRRNVVEESEQAKRDDFTPNVDFYEPNLLSAVENGNVHAARFFFILALCHTVMAEGTGDNLEYQAQSPDEKALVSAARNFGFIFKFRTPQTIRIGVSRKNGNEIVEEEETYELLCNLDFTYERKRMSIIVKRDEKIMLLCKGADSVIFERLHSSCDEAKTLCTQHVHDFAKDGLRIICLAEKEIPQNIWKDWKQKYDDARVSFEGRDEKVAAACDEIEKDLILVGATAVEDKLQDGVPDAIANLAKAGIKIWVLTGDKQETAIDIAKSCQLLPGENTNLVKIKRELSDEIATQIDNALNRINTVTSKFGQINDAKKSKWGLVIDGQTLADVLRTDLKQRFLELCYLCKSVICCRVTPLQKAEVVDLIKTNTKSVTLAIGDGANDVSMIKTAHIGVGISGQEGLQAVLASDYSISQFRYLERLLLVHGRWSYFRMSKFLRYFFYKNFAFALCHLWFGFFCGFSAQTVFDPFFISFYNLFYTSLPCLILAAFDQDVDDISSLKKPELYTPGRTGELFNKKVFLWGAAEGIITSCILFFIPYGAYHMGNNDIDHQSFGVVVAFILVVAVNIRCALDTSYWTGFNHVVIWGSILFYLCLTLAMYANVWNYEYIGTDIQVYSTSNFWLCLVLTNVILLVPVIAYRFYLLLKNRILVYPGHFSEASITSSQDQITRSERSGDLITSLRDQNERSERSEASITSPHDQNERSERSEASITSPQDQTTRSERLEASITSLRDQTTRSERLEASITSSRDQIAHSERSGDSITSLQDQNTRSAGSTRSPGQILFPVEERPEYNAF